MTQPLLRERTFRRFWTGQTISLFGDQVSVLALPLVGVLVVHADAAEMGYLTAAGLVPSLLFSLPAGAWVDRHGHRRRVMLVADLVRAVLLATIPLAYAFGVLGFAQLYAVAFLSGSVGVFFFVAYSTLFVSLLPADRFVEGNALLYGSRAASYVGGQSLAGILVAALSAPVALLADALSFLASAFVLTRIAPVEPPTEPSGRGHLLGGVRFIVHSRIVRSALAATATVNLFTFIFSALFILYATRVLQVPPVALGLVLGAGAVGSLLGAALTSRLSARIGIGPAVIIGCVLFPAPLALVPLAEGAKPLVLAALSLAEFGSGVGVMILDISLGSIFAALIPDPLRARVTGAYMMVNYGVRPLGALAGGVLGSTLGLRSTLWIAVIGAVGSGLWLVPSPMARLRILPERNG